MVIPQFIRINPPQYIRLSKGDYYIECLLGEGGFGNVYKALFNNTYYALKLNRFWEMHPQERAEIKKRIYQEFVISKTIQSSHLVYSHGYEEVEGNPLIIYDYCDGGSLKDVITQNFPSQYYKDISIQVLSGLNDLHSNNVIHRDLKPENVLFRQGKVALTDFGISANLNRRLTQINKRGYVQQIFASVCYSAPEQADKTVAYEFTGPNNDIFSFGVMMYEWFTHGQMPYGSITEFESNPNKYEEKKKEGNWNRGVLEKMVPDKVWIDIINNCLEPDPNERYLEVKQIIDQLNPKYNYVAASSQNVEVAIPSSPAPQINTKCILQVLEGVDTGKEYNLNNLIKNKGKRILKIGRFDPLSPQENDIPLTEEKSSFISRNHATIEMQPKGEATEWIIRDGQFCARNGTSQWLYSRNGLFVNDKKVEGMLILKTNDIIQIGKIKLLFFNM
jgi:serine/threonine protein kinase